MSMEQALRYGAMGDLGDLHRGFYDIQASTRTQAIMVSEIDSLSHHFISNTFLILVRMTMTSML